MEPDSQHVVSAKTQDLQLFSLETLPEITAGNDLAKLIVAALAREKRTLVDGDIVVVAQKIVSKSEGRLIDLEDIVPDYAADELAGKCGKDPRLVSLILSESDRILRQRDGLIIAVHRRGYVMANAGIDQSNVGNGNDGTALLLPEDPDASAHTLCTDLREQTGVRVGVIVSDSFGRPWRLGTTGVALGVWRPPALIDLRGAHDRDQRPLRVSETGFGDEIAAAASLMMGQADEGRPVVVVRGLAWTDSDQTGANLVRPAEQDLFR